MKRFIGVLLFLVLLSLTSACTTSPPPKSQDEIISLGKDFVHGCVDGVLSVAQALRIRISPNTVRMRCMKIFLQHSQKIQQKHNDPIEKRKLKPRQGSRGRGKISSFSIIRKNNG